MADTPESRNIGIAFGLNFGFTIIEIIGGLLTNSTAILADAVHDLGDSFALGVAWYLEKISRKGGDDFYSYGYRRFSLLGALVSSTVLIFGTFIILSQVIPRLFDPEPTDAGGMIFFACLGLVVNGAAVLRLKNRQSLNVNIVAWHLIEDILSWLAILVLSVVLMFKDYYILDPALSLLITFFVLYKVLRNLKNTLNIFLQGTPAGINLYHLEEELSRIDGIKRLHHTHLWSLDGVSHVFSTHVELDPCEEDSDVGKIKGNIRTILEKLGIEHSTIEIENSGQECPLNSPSCGKI